MMKKNSDILNKLRYETENTNVIHLWLEGMFWKAYERSAYLFVHRISEYKPYKKFVRAVGGEVVAIGFPSKKLDKLLEGRSVEYIDEKHYILNGFTVDSKELRDFQTWKKGIPAFPYHIIVETDASAPPKESNEKTDVFNEKSDSAKNTDITCECKTNSLPEVHALLEDIRRFRMESATPLECMMFLAQIIKKSLTIRHI